MRGFIILGLVRKNSDLHGGTVCCQLWPGYLLGSLPEENQGLFTTSRAELVVPAEWRASDGKPSLPGPGRARGERAGAGGQAS